MYIRDIPVGMLGTNCYLLGDEESRQLAIIDPGDDEQDIFAAIRESGMTPAMILLTHGHFDHVTAVPAVLKEYPGLPVYITEADYAEATQPSMFTNGIGEIPNVHYYGEGSQVQLGSITVEVLSTPGHTPGSVTLKAGNALFTGDTLFAGSCGRTDFPGGSYRQMMASLKRLALLEGDYAVYPGHEGGSTLERERKYNSFMQAALGGSR